MKTSVRLLLTALGIAAASASLNAQVSISTIPTIGAPNNYAPNANSPTEQGGGLGQLMRFNNSVTSPSTGIPTTPIVTSTSHTFQSFSWYFTSADNDPIAAGIDVIFYLSEWNTGTSKPENLLWESAGIVLPGYSGSYTYSSSFTGGLFVDPAKTYALMARVMSTPAEYATDFKLATTTASQIANPFRSFTWDQNAPDGTFGSVISSDFSTAAVEAAFAINLAPIPESGTVAVAFAGILVAGLAVRRRAVKSVVTVA